MLKIAKKEKRELAPIELTGRTIASSYWGNAWCENLERYSDFESRLPRGRTYVRNGSVVDLQIQKGKVTALVSGSELYRITIDIQTLPGPTWSKIKKDCSRSIDSLMDLLQGRFDQGVMERLSRREGGLFPKRRKSRCVAVVRTMRACANISPPRFTAWCCLDAEPELLFTLRDVDHLELISQAVDSESLDEALVGKAPTRLNASDLGEIFGIELEEAASPPKSERKTRKTAPRKADRKKSKAMKKSQK